MDARTSEALSRGYALAGAIARRGVTAEDLESLRAEPRLWAALPRSMHGAETIDLDEINARHYALFGLEVYAHRRVFTSSDALAGDDDHLGDVLGELAAAVLEDDTTVLRERLLPWLAPVTIAIRDHGDAFFIGLADLVLDLVVLHCVAAAVVVQKTRTEAWTLGDDDGLGVLVDRLLVPRDSGALLTHGDLAKLVHHAGVPGGFGSRRLVLKNLFQSSANFETTDALLAALIDRFSRAEEHLDAWAVDYPLLAPAGAGWREQAGRTAAQLRSIREASSAGARGLFSEAP